jgi:hypothetical protein
MKEYQITFGHYVQGYLEASEECIQLLEELNAYIIRDRGATYMGGASIHGIFFRKERDFEEHFLHIPGTPEEAGELKLKSGRCVHRCNPAPVGNDMKGER